jgi:hypothetical protein
MKNLLTTLLLGIGLSTNALTIEQVWAEINYCELKHPEIVLAQSIWETNWEYSTTNAVKRQNLFGLKGGKKSESNKYGYKIFEHWTESVDDYKNRIQNRYIEREDYFQFLIRIKYFQEDPKIYISNIKSIIKRLKQKGII